MGKRKESPEEVELLDYEDMEKGTNEDQKQEETDRKEKYEASGQGPAKEGKKSEKK